MPFKPNTRARALFNHLCALAIFSILAYGFFAPPAAHGDFTYFGYGGDPLAYIWFLNWWPFALEHHLALFHTYFMDFPAGTSLAWKTSVPALSLVAAPFTAAFGAVNVANALFIIAPALTAWGGYLAAFELTGRFAPSLMAGLVFGFSSYMMSQLQGHLNLVFIPAVPFAFWLCATSLRRGWNRWQLGIPLGGLLALQFGISQEIFASFCMFAVIGLAAFWVLHAQGRETLLRLIPGLATSLLVCVVLASPLIWQMLLGYKAGQGGVPPTVNYSSDLAGFLFPTPIDWLGGRSCAAISREYPGNISEQSAYIGLPLLLLLVYIFRKYPKPVYRVLAFVAVLAAVFSLGPRLHVLGVILGPAPWTLLYRLPFLNAMLPARFMLYSFGAIALMVAFWLAEPGRKFPRYVLLAICLVFLIPSRSADRNWTTLAIPKPLIDGTIPQGSNILILPYFGSEMGYQYASGMRFHLVGQGYLGGSAPMPFAAWPLFPALFNEEFQEIDPRQFAAYLSAYHANYVVITSQLYRDYNLGISRDTNAEKAAAVRLLRAAGWVLAKATADTIIMQPAT